MALPPDITDSAPSAKLKKKKKKSRREEEGKNEEKERKRGGEERKRGGEERKQGGEERKQGGEEMKQGGEERKQGGEERKQGGEERKRGGEERKQGGEEMKKKSKKKRRHEETLEVKERDEEEVTRKKKKRRENETQPKETTQGGQERKRDEERTQGGQERTQGVKERTQGGQERTQVVKERTQVVKERTQVVKERTQGVKERTQGVKKRTQGGQEKRKKKPRKQNKEAALEEMVDMSDTEMEIEFSVSDLLELEQFIPDIRSKSLEVKQKYKRYDLQRFRAMKQRGLKLRWGKWSRQENLQLKKNVEDFLKLTGIESAEQLFFPQRFPDRTQTLKTLKAKHGFFLRLAEDLLRTCDQVYVRGKKLYDQRNHLGRFSEAELQALQTLHTIHGNDWKTIGDKLERSVYACQKRYDCIRGNRGHWSEDELRRFLKVTKKHLTRVLMSSHQVAAPSAPSARADSAPSALPDHASSALPDHAQTPTFVQLCTKLPWTKISRKVKTRNWLQCRVKWFTYLKSRIKAVEPKMRIPGASLQTKIRLIQTLFELQVDDSSDVDWLQVAQTVGGVTQVCAQKLFHRMKVSRIPNWTQSSFGEIVDFLFEKELPRLLKKSDPSPELDPVQIRLNQLFPPDLEDFTEVDNT